LEFGKAFVAADDDDDERVEEGCDTLEDIFGPSAIEEGEVVFIGRFCRKPKKPIHTYTTDQWMQKCLQLERQLNMAKTEAEAWRRKFHAEESKVTSLLEKRSRSFMDEEDTEEDTEEEEKKEEEKSKRYKVVIEASFP